MTYKSIQMKNLVLSIHGIFLPNLWAFCLSSVKQQEEKTVRHTPLTIHIWISITTEINMSDKTRQMYWWSPPLLSSPIPLGLIPSVSLSAMRGSSCSSSVLGLVTTMEVRGVTKLYCRDISRAWAVAFPFSSAVPVSLTENHRINGVIALGLG